jgi:hypothetical protein
MACVSNVRPARGDEEHEEGAGAKPHGRIVADVQSSPAAERPPRSAGDELRRRLTCGRLSAWTDLGRISRSDRPGRGSARVGQEGAGGELGGSDGRRKACADRTGSRGHLGVATRPIAAGIAQATDQVPGLRAGVASTGQARPNLSHVGVPWRGARGGAWSISERRVGLHDLERPGS